jgi:hypothetical protein
MPIDDPDNATLRPVFRHFIRLENVIPANSFGDGGHA